MMTLHEEGKLMNIFDNLMKVTVISWGVATAGYCVWVVLNEVGLLIGAIIGLF